MLNADLKLKLLKQYYEELSTLLSGYIVLVEIIFVRHSLFIHNFMCMWLYIMDLNHHYLVTGTGLEPTTT